ncbi:methyltransferase domain-containing protein [Streptomyces flavotricini]|uniref:Protein-L-isoaspartate O-methyltransferase n=1 Tax=Streptomyces flavotricini TaxID=66888 RepID=A0ABS8EI11_9ACTN|nr:methyltransferase domain-containing protein [Streptomyces flavotricini]MCC0100667.1 methyltransferase domain-containing protein [Streptomyces flavotricini]
MPTAPDAPAAGTLADGLLGQVAEQLGRPLPACLQEAFQRVPRHRFLPDRIWLRDGSGGYRPVDRTTDPADWLAAAYTDQPLVTHFTGGLPSSSASMPSMVARMLLLAGLTEPNGPDQAPLRVLELGAGTGFNAGLLCILAGDEQVTTIDLDPDLAATAQENLKRVGRAPTVVAADGAGGWPPGAPYDVVLATFSVDHIPPKWLTGLRPAGGRIVTPWTSAWCSYGTLELTATEGGQAHGRFHSFASFMPMARPHAKSHPPTTTPAGDDSAAFSATGLSPWAVAGGDLDAEFHIGLTVPGASYSWDTSGDHAHTRLQIQDPATGSWATVDYDGRTAAEFAVTQAGSRRLWDEVTAAYRRWEELGRPSVDSYGLTVTAGATVMWAGSPASPVAES